MGIKFDVYVKGSLAWAGRHPEFLSEKQRNVAILRALSPAEVEALESDVLPSEARVREIAAATGQTPEVCDSVFRGFCWFFRKEGLRSPSNS